MEEKKYAPVIIPTLNRHEHFKRCLESLEKCIGADKTDVYIALDYPPSQKYKSGWKKIDSYISDKEKKHGFGNLFVIRRDRNYGVGHENSNGTVLQREIMEKYEYYIFSEDDNEFSENFLLYMNACFKRFIDDERIVKICGYNFPIEMPDMYKNNFYISKRFCAWGSGSWSKKNEVIMKDYYNLNALRNIIIDDTKYNKLKKIFPHGISLIHSMLKVGKLHGDAIYEVYANLEDKYFVLPTVSKVRNYGNDGSGVHSLKMIKSVNDLYTMQQIDQSLDFEFTDDVFTYEPFSLKSKYYKDKFTFRSIYKRLVINIDFWLLRHCGFMPKSKYI